MTSAKYYKENKDRVLTQTRARYLANPDKYLQYQREYREKNKLLVAQKTKQKRAARWAYAIKLLGGCCSNCKQTYDPVCYDLHHVNSQEKEFTIGENMLVGKARFEKEVQKCILLCSNCHRLKHKENNDN